MTVATQKERITALESARGAHAHEHKLLDRLWASKLDVIDARLGTIEEVLQQWRLPAATGKLSKRDVGVFSGTVALASALWWLLEQLGLVTVGG